MKTQKVKISDLRAGPIRQEILPEGFVIRVITYREKLKDVLISSLEQTLSDFQRDYNPERELAVWEYIANQYEEAVQDKPDMDLEEKKKILGNLLFSTMH